MSILEGMRFSLLLGLVAVSLHAQDSLRLDLGGGQAMELIQIKPGTFTQGSPAGEAGRGADETERPVTISQAYYIGKYPVTRGQFGRFVAATNFRTEAERGPSGGFGWEGGKLVQKKEYSWRNPGFAQTDEHPVVVVTYADATAFCAWLSRQTGRQVALPSEAQWEYAARGGGQAGEGWHAGNSPSGTQPVGRKAANGLGLSDMLGNAWEWCEDWYAPYAAGAVADPRQTNSNLSDKPRRVLRGGAFSRPANEARAAKRFRNDPGSRNADNGFRVVVLGAVAAAPVKPAVPPSTPASPPVPAPTNPAPADHHEPLPTQNGGGVSTPLFPQALDGSTTPLESSGGGGSILQWVLIGAVVVVGLMLVRKIFAGGGGASPYRRQPPASGPMMGATSAYRQGQTSQSGPFQIRTVADGFWILGNVLQGTMLDVMWNGMTSSHTRSLGYQPGPQGHFVFTGEPPTQVAVTVSGDQQSGSYIDAPILPSSFSTPSHHQTPPPRQSFSGYPSAY